MFSENELKITSLKIRGLSNKEIAAKLNVSEPYVSQVLGTVRGKIGSVKDSVSLLTQMGVLHEGPMLSLTEKGREFTDMYGKSGVNCFKVAKTVGQLSLGVHQVSLEEEILYPSSIKSLQIYGFSTVFSSLGSKLLASKAYKEISVKRNMN
jgi:DNA-binding CsgD family transcriptional regulator